MSVLGRPSILLLFSRIVLAILGPLISKWILPSIFQFLQKKKNACWIFDRDSVESVNQFGHIYHLNNVNLSTHEHFPFTYIFFNFFKQCFGFLAYKILNFVKYIPDFFLLFWCYCKGSFINLMFGLLVASL